MCKNWLVYAAAVALAGVAWDAALAQYPTITPEVAAESDRRMAEMRRRSDAAWEAAQPAIEADAKAGKPYIADADHPSELPQASIPAFPGAEGGGAYSFGGRGGKVIVVTNLNDSGPGSFREAVETGGARIVVFNVAGVIELKSRLVVRAPYLTINGASAPGDGVCIAGDTVELETHDVVVRHMRFRRGDTWVGDRNDSFGGNPIGNIMIDHVSASWGLDENMSMYRHMYSPPEGGKDIKMPTVNITIQNSIFSEALDTYNHAFGSTIGGYNSTFHHNLWACNTGRNPSVGMVYDFTLVNNVLFNWRHRTVDGGDHRSYYTIVNNYYKPGPVTPADKPIAHRVLKPESRRSPYYLLDYGRAYVAGNVVEGSESVTADNWDGGVQVDIGEPRGPLPKGVRVPTDEELLAEIRIDKPYPHAPISTQSAEEAYEIVLAGAGATLPRRDAVDERVIQMVRSGEVTYKKGIITDIEQVGGYPEYRGEPYADADSDGMPDTWEKANGLDPNDAADAAGDLNNDGYTNIEEFLNGEDPRAEAKQTPAPQPYVDIFWNS
ncbi:hypothetical protein Mal64_14400 [Pseudobythopirellula maris]|uniref:Pectate trisaccharide-lyase n=1 Tax=Pseudobythopirellula maris TaxID=2527991 RepID=A0A5C5ZVR3_9BACT|nr:pectate lyase [Pseudobythopirellula maris]TWT91041.1 hypothetical protein Mal64_14400 [Pseudobythopirellula maris]